ncbi:Non-histone chromosomal protein 6 [Terramyces sp. JEL0728]|nr:Non-histone chromosomal protein 6 [Terramyces sp. JEL0728]
MISCGISKVSSNVIASQKKIKLPPIREYIAQTENGAATGYNSAYPGNWPHDPYYLHHYEHGYPYADTHVASARHYSYYNYHPYYPQYVNHRYNDTDRHPPKHEQIVAQPSKMKRQKKDPSAPKHPMSPFIYYLAEVRSQFTAKNPGKSGGEISKIIATHWRQMSDQDKIKYNEQCLNDKKRYAQEMVEWTRKKSPKLENPNEPTQESSQVTYVE